MHAEVIHRAGHPHRVEVLADDPLAGGRLLDLRYEPRAGGGFQGRTQGADEVPGGLGAPDGYLQAGEGLMVPHPRYFLGLVPAAMPLVKWRQSLQSSNEGFLGRNLRIVSWTYTCRNVRKSFLPIANDVLMRRIRTGPLFVLGPTILEYC